MKTLKNLSITLFITLFIAACGGGSSSSENSSADGETAPEAQAGNASAPQAQASPVFTFSNNQTVVSGSCNDIVGDFLILGDGQSTGISLGLATTPDAGVVGRLFNSSGNLDFESGVGCDPGLTGGSTFQISSNGIVVRIETTPSTITARILN